jgi:hypothetical protein
MPSTVGIVASGVVDPDLVLVFDTALGDLTVEMPLAGTVNCVIDWGDGSSDAYTTTGNEVAYICVWWCVCGEVVGDADWVWGELCLGRSWCRVCRLVRSV